MAVGGGGGGDDDRKQSTLAPLIGILVFILSGLQHLGKVSVSPHPLSFSSDSKNLTHFQYFFHVFKLRRTLLTDQFEKCSVQRRVGGGGGEGGAPLGAPQLRASSVRNIKVNNMLERSVYSTMNK
jgi:hypothetical protein